MYCNFFGLRCLPFDDRADARFFHATTVCSEILAAIEQEAPYDKGITLVVGEAGTGKTTFIRALVQRLHACDHVVVLTWPAGGGMSLLRETCKGFGVTLPSSGGRARCLARIRRHLLSTAEAKHRSLLIVDQAENLDAKSLGDIGRLTDLQNDDGGLLTIILAGKPPLRSLFDQPECTELGQRLSAEYTLPALTLPETRQYIQHRLRIAGAGEADLFEQEAVTLIHEASGGVPRMINRFCHAAMRAAFDAGQTRITKTVVSSETLTSTMQERSADIRDVGLSDAGQLTAGLTGSGRIGTPTWAQHDPVASETRPNANVACIDEQLGDFSGDFPPDAEESDLDGIPGVGEGGADICRSLAGLLGRGEGLLERLERSLARAERTTLTLDTSLDQQTEIEHRLATLSDRTERACERADRTGSRLKSFAEELGEHADRVQQNMAELMTGLGAGEEMRGKLRTTMEQLSSGAVDVVSKVASKRAELQETFEESERLREKLIESTLESCRARIEEQFQAQKCAYLEGVDAAQSRLQTVLETILSRAGDAETKIDRRSHELDEQLAAAECQAGALKDRMDKVAGDALAHVESAEAAEEKLQGLLEQVPTTTQAAESRILAVLEQASTFTADAEAAVRTQEANLQEKMDEAEEFQEQFANAALAGYRKKLREQFDAHVRTQQDEITAARAELETLLDRVSTAGTDADAAAARLAAQAREGVEEAGRLHEQFASAALESNRGELREQLETCEREQRKFIEASESDLRTIREQVTSLTAEAKATLENALSTHRSSVQEMVDDSASQIQAAEDTVAAGRERLDQTLAICRQSQEKLVESTQNEVGQILAGCERAKAELIDTVRQEIDELSSRVEGIETRCADVRSSFEILAGDVERSDTRVADLREASHRLQTTVDEQIQRAKATQANLSNIIQQGERMLLDVQASSGQVEALQHNVAASLVNIGSACERAKGVEGQLARCEQVIARLACAHEDGEQTEKRLRKIVSEASRLQEAMQRMATDAEGKVGQLDSHTAAATHLLRELGETNVTGHALLEQANESTHLAETAAASTKEHINRLIQEVWSLTGKTEVSVKELSGCNAHAAELIERLRQTTPPAQEAARELGGQIESADHHTKRLQAEYGQAGKLTERLKRVARIVKVARDIDAGVRKSVDEARALHGELTVVNDNASQQCAKLQTANETAGGLLETQGRLTEDAQVSAQQLAEQLSAAEATGEAGERLLNEFVKQADTLRRDLEGLGRKSAEIERTVTRLSANPAEIVAGAQAQAAQLEQVCGAVRRVFAGLSKSSLEARKHTNEFRETSREAQERLNRLAADTDRAANTLHEWVEEAARAQARLERTLQECPSIRETHPGETIRELSHPVKPVARIANPSADKELDIATASQGDDQLRYGEASKPVEVPKEQVIAKPAGRADEISQMIEDAKHAAARVNS